MKRFCVYYAMLLSGCLFGANLVPNLSFEGSGDAPTGWLRYQAAPDQLLYRAGTGDEGSFVVGIGDLPEKTGGGWMGEAFLRVTPGEYRLSCRIRAENAWGNAAGAVLYTLENGKPKWLQTEHTPMVDGKRGWTRVERVFSIPREVCFLRVSLVRRWGGKGISWFDAVSLERLSPETAVEEKPFRLALEKALTAENIPVGKALREEAIPAVGWQKLEEKGGTLTESNGVLTIADTALRGVGWLSPAFAVEPGEVYGFEAMVTLHGAWHTRLAAVLLDGDDRVMEIRMGAESKELRREIRCRVGAGVRRVRFAVLQERSGGRSEWKNFSLKKY